MSAPSASLFRNPLVWLRRFRHRRGYGVHSPFAFAFITGVIYERLPYYAYTRLSRLHPWWVRWLRLQPLQRCRLLFRLANYAEPRTVCLVGLTDTYNKYVRAAVTRAQFRECASCAEAVASDFVVVGTRDVQAAAALCGKMSAGAMLVVEGIHDSAANLSVWQDICDDGNTCITFDLYDFGIALFDHRLAKQHYVVNF